MKIVGILQKNEYFYVFFERNWLEKLFNLGLEEDTRVYKHIGRTFGYTHDPIYIDKDGKKLPMYSNTAEYINKFKRKKLFFEEEMNLNMN